MARDPGTARTEVGRVCVLDVWRVGEPRSLPWGRRAGKGHCGETSYNAPDAKKGTHRHDGHQADNTHTLRGVRHDAQPHAVTHVSQQQAVRTHKHADARVTARTVQCLLKRCPFVRTRVVLSTIPSGYLHAL